MLMFKFKLCLLCSYVVLNSMSCATGNKFKFVPLGSMLLQYMYCNMPYCNIRVLQYQLPVACCWWVIVGNTFLQNKIKIFSVSPILEFTCVLECTRVQCTRVYSSMCRWYPDTLEYCNMAIACYRYVFNNTGTCTYTCTIHTHVPVVQHAFCAIVPIYVPG